MKGYISLMELVVSQQVEREVDLLTVSPTVRLQRVVTTIERFLKQQDRLLDLLHQARRIDLTASKTPVSVFRLVRLRLGDTFRFLINHIERHVLQAEQVATKLTPVEKAVTA